MRSPWFGEPYYEELSLDTDHVRMARLTSGDAPVLAVHNSASLNAVVGVVESARLEKGRGAATVRFAKNDADADRVWNKVQQRVLRNVSVGYQIHRAEKIEAADNKIPTVRAIDWEPFEISVVPMGADANAKMRGADPAPTNPCQLVVTKARSTQETKMEDEHRSDGVLELVDPLEPPKPAATPAEPTERDAGADAENERIAGIRAACLNGRMTRSFEDKLINDRKMTLVKAQGLVLEELKKRGKDEEGPRRGPDGGADVEVGADPLLHVRAGIEGAILHRISPDRFPLDDRSRPYRGMSMLDVGRAFLHARGIRTTQMDRSRLVDALLSRAGSGLHTTTDFPGLFEDAANKNLRAAYEAAPQTWQPISRLVSLSDFKPSRQLQVGDAPALLEILEHGEYTFGTIGEAKEVIQLKTYGRMFGITRQALINDDLNAFGEVPAAFGRKARDIESDLAWAQITSNPNMGDGIALFTAATHFNLTTGPGTVISVTSLGVGRAALRNQKGIDGTTLLNLVPRYLIVPAALETIADQFVTQITPALAGSVNPFTTGGRTPLTVIVEPRLDVNSAIAWYMATSTDSAPVLYHGILDGQEGPLVTQQEGFDVDGMKFRCRIDVAFKAADWRAIYKNVGV
ncbi:MAG TPA: prohead protease/major capsid protein fusion protein [Kofleriaceae bacterium]|nr:prohead protease/major capsid protein fusion protein [Kofleriaceae bacterium]